jgi:hypothetical protein
MNLNHPRWDGHQFNMRRTNPVHYNNSTNESMRIRNLHSNESKTTLNEWASLSSDKGQLKMEPENHALSDDRHGLVVNHLNEVNKYIDEVSLHKFVQDVNEIEERLGYVKKNR